MESRPKRKVNKDSACYKKDRYKREFMAAEKSEARLRSKAEKARAEYEKFMGACKVSKESRSMQKNGLNVPYNPAKAKQSRDITAAIKRTYNLNGPRVYGRPNFNGKQPTVSNATKSARNAIDWDGKNHSIAEYVRAAENYLIKNGFFDYEPEINIIENPIRKVKRIRVPKQVVKGPSLADFFVDRKKPKVPKEPKKSRKMKINFLEPDEEDEMVAEGLVGARIKGRRRLGRGLVGAGAATGGKIRRNRRVLGRGLVGAKMRKMKGGCGMCDNCGYEM